MGGTRRALNLAGPPAKRIPVGRSEPVKARPRQAAFQESVHSYSES
jgi:hypothetical protein